ncbi:hypothetical protein QVD17_35859 [Tagetes erecta]|uniref:Uncharacterized protein n=1 Tax=Tagetes erecta TaxID=13708 RepID=A0AAD8JTA2_TARER|nr:hypothetical protein QVD17_35859 [Tagetes erecta]
MITGRRPTDSIFQEGLNLHGYVHMALPDRLMEIIEPMLVSTYMEAANGFNREEERRLKRLEDGMNTLARIGLGCSMESPGERMSTSSILNELFVSRRLTEFLGLYLICRWGLIFLLHHLLKIEVCVCTDVEQEIEACPINSSFKRKIGSQRLGGRFQDTINPTGEATF